MVVGEALDTATVPQGGTRDSLLVVLSTQPSDKVTVIPSGNFDLSVEGQATTTPTAFTLANWNVTQSAAVAAIEKTAAAGL